MVELLNVDDTVRHLIYEGTMTQLYRYLGEIKFDSFRMAAIEKVTNGATTLQEVLRVLPHSALSRKF
jgi:type II secretory ATPase GspE/PulE/Tfp pilus assembly ATPase PilB-like protein